MVRTTHQNLRWLGALALAAITAVTVAASDAIMHREVSELLQQLEHSNCEFSRNGRWYDAKAARAHLEKKYRYLVDRDLAKTAEDFIEMGGTKSSMTGRPYEVRCGDQPAVTSARWLTEELRRVRATALHPAATNAAGQSGINP